MRERENLGSIPIIAAALAGNATRAQYLRFLERAFHHVKHTPSLLMACGARLGHEREWLRQALAHYVEEELGHHEWILADVAAAGGDAEAVRRGDGDLDTRLMVAYAYDTVTRRNPLGLLGMVYVLEGTSIALAIRVAEALQRSLDLPRAAFTYLASHGELDREHIGHFAGLVERLDDPADRDCVAASARDFFHLYGNVLRGVAVEEAA